MKRLALLLLAACSTEDNLGNHVFGDSRWSISIGSPGEERATAVTVDAIGNVIVAGTCDGLVKFGVTTRDCHGGFITLRAWDTGAELWTVVLPDATITTLSLDDVGNVIATGTRPTAMGSDPVMVVLDPAGALIDSLAVGLVGTAVSMAGTVEPDGCMFLTGGFHGTMPTAQGAMTNETGELDGFVSGHFAEMTRAWTVRFAGEADQLGSAIALHGDRLTVLARSAAPLHVGAQTVDADAWPASVLMQFSVTGVLHWTYVLPATSDHVAVAGDSSIVVTEVDEVVGCTRLRGFGIDGRERWASACSARRSTDAIAIGVDGTIVSGGRSFDLASGELFLAAHDANGNPIGSVQAQPYPFERDSTLDGIAIEPTGEVAFVGTVNHPFDFGNGMVAFEGMHDAVIVKLDSPTGQDGPIVLLRE